jgi:hypothetical protein
VQGLVWEGVGAEFAIPVFRELAGAVGFFVGFHAGLAVGAVAGCYLGEVVGVLDLAQVLLEGFFGAEAGWTHIDFTLFTIRHTMLADKQPINITFPASIRRLFRRILMGNLHLMGCIPQTVHSHLLLEHPRTQIRHAIPIIIPLVIRHPHKPTIIAECVLTRFANGYLVFAA